MSEQIYNPQHFVIGYWSGSQWVISVVDLNANEPNKPFFASDLRLATAAIEAKLMEIREEEK
jgi:hypothetical protein